MSTDLLIFLGTMGVSALGAAYGYGKLSAGNDQNLDKIKEYEIRQKKENENLWKVVGDVRRSLEEHVKDSSDKRFEFEKELSKLRELAGNRDGKLDAIISQLGKMEVKIDRLEKAHE